MIADHRKKKLSHAIFTPSAGGPGSNSNGNRSTSTHKYPHHHHKTMMKSVAKGVAKLSLCGPSSAVIPADTDCYYYEIENDDGTLTTETATSSTLSNSFSSHPLSSPSPIRLQQAPSVRLVSSSLPPGLSLSSSHSSKHSKNSSSKGSSTTCSTKKQQQLQQYKPKYSETLDRWYLEQQEQHRRELLYQLQEREQPRLQREWEQLELKRQWEEQQQRQQQQQQQQLLLAAGSQHSQATSKKLDPTSRHTHESISASCSTIRRRGGGAVDLDETIDDYDNGRTVDLDDTVIDDDDDDDSLFDNLPEDPVEFVPFMVDNDGSDPRRHPLEQQPQQRSMGNEQQDPNEPPAIVDLADDNHDVHSQQGGDSADCYQDPPLAAQTEYAKQQLLQSTRYRETHNQKSKTKKRYSYTDSYHTHEDEEDPYLLDEVEISRGLSGYEEGFGVPTVTCHEYQHVPLKIAEEEHEDDKGDQASQSSASSPAHDNRHRDSNTGGKSNSTGNTEGETITVGGDSRKEGSVNASMRSGSVCFHCRNGTCDNADCSNSRFMI